MNLYHLRYFIELVRTRHYTRAAENLGITQPTLSHAIHQLEEELGVALFEKQGRKTRLTRFGEAFVSTASASLEILDSGVNALKQEAAGSGLIRIGMLRPLGVEFIPGLTACFLKQYTRLNIHFTFHTGNTHYLLEGLTAREYDLVFCSRPSQNLKLSAEPIAYQELVVIVPKGHPLSAKRTVDLEETLAYPQVYFAEGAGVRDDVDALYSTIGRSPDIAYEIEEDQVVAGMVAHGFGIAIVPYMDLLLRLNVSILTIHQPMYKRRIYMVKDEALYAPPAVELFEQFVRDQQLLRGEHPKIVL